ncbi:protein PFF0380w-like [Vespula squamosa]|uniref:Protein PFF0380w-like n=1 Tax=Vespula squamosa TaxID=30214 RepID=A0ABD2AXX5_VESSQ
MLGGDIGKFQLIGIILICSFLLQIHSSIYDDKINLQIKDNLQNIEKKHSNDIKTMKISKLKYILRNTTNKCGLEKTCSNIEKNVKNSDNYNNQKIINLVPPLTTSKDYYTYFNRRKKELKNKNLQNDTNQHNVQNHKYEKQNTFINPTNPRIESNHLSYMRDHAPVDVTKETSQNQIEYNKIYKKKSSTNVSQISPDGDRVEFQIQGHEGPKTYIFGFDTGVGKNRQYRLEERFNDGTVKGHYGYYDARGKLRTVKYIAKPIEGYQEKHHETIIHGVEH